MAVKYILNIADGTYEFKLEVELLTEVFTHLGFKHFLFYFVEN